MTAAISGKRILVLGLGLTGLSMIRWLRTQGALVSAADSRLSPPNLVAVRAEMPNLQIHLGPFRAETFTGIDLVAASPGVPLSDAALAHAIAAGTPAVGDIELFAWGLDEYVRQHRLRRPRVIAITGSNGKSTVTEMAGEACREAGLETLVAGNIGLPVLDALSEIEAGTRPLPQAVVLELSSFQLETTSTLRPDAATVLNVSEDHLDRYAGMNQYAWAKSRVFLGARVAIVNRDDPRTTGMVSPNERPWSFGFERPPGEHAWGLITAGGEEWIAEGDQPVMRTAALKVTGRHNAANAMAVLALGRAIGLTNEPIVRALERFRGLAHRVEFVAEVEGRRYFDDSKGTNVGATVAALAGMPQPVVLIAGGDGKGQDFSPLGPVAALRARAVILIGRDAPLIEAALAPCGVRVVKAEDMDQAVSQAAAVSEPGDAVLLSPACASFDMYRNYEHRADVFRDAVGRSKEGKACSA